MMILFHSNIICDLICFGYLHGENSAGPFQEHLRYTSSLNVAYMAPWSEAQINYD